MKHNDHVRLLRKGVPESGVWADLGSGSGAFTLALADLLGESGRIYSVDKDRQALKEQERSMRSLFPSVAVEFLVADFTRKLDLPPLDGIVMANSLHYVRDKGALLQRIRACLKPEGRLLLVEYNVDHGNVWVPYPLSYPTWERLAQQNNFSDTQLLEKVPSRFLGEIYSAMSFAQ